MMYFVIVEKNKFYVTEEKKVAIMSAIDAGAKLIQIGDNVIHTSYIRGIIEEDLYISQENDELAKWDKRRCKKCGMIIKMDDRCPCWDKPEIREQLLFKPVETKGFTSIASVASTLVLPEKTKQASN